MVTVTCPLTVTGRPSAVTLLLSIGTVSVWPTAAPQSAKARAGKNA
jgi:hypothetical protein